MTPDAFIAERLPKKRYAVMCYLLAMACVTSCFGTTVSAQERLEWKYKRFHWAEGLSTVVLAAGALGLRAVEPSRNWTRVNKLDNWFRDKFTANTDKQERISDVSDAFLIITVAFPVLVDTFGVALVGDSNEEVAVQMFGIQLQAFALTGFVTNVAKAAGRERPYAQEAGCGHDVDCGAAANKSFFSGHTSMAFTGAGLTCVEHLHLKLFGRVGDPLTCATALTMASLTGLFRVLANRHWTTDVMTGAGVGLVSGWLMPWLMHYRHKASEKSGRKTRYLRNLAPYGKRGAFGMSIAGTF